MSIEDVLQEHKLWLESNGENGVRADLWGADLRGANLRGADLRGADLWGANLRDADLWGANLRGANLRDADLWGADLRDADLRDANLRDADLRDADLRGCAGERSRIKSIFCSDVYPITYTAERLQIGCENHSFEEWHNFSDEEISRMDGGALDFWREFKDFIFTAIERFPAK